MFKNARQRFAKQKIQLKTTEQWLANKAQRDKVTGNLWRIHDKCYDLTPFIQRHPGGPDWLTLTKGCDITDFYETFHVNINKANSYLKQYFVCDEIVPAKKVFEYDPSGFYCTLREKVNKIFPTQESRRCDFSMHIISAVATMLQCLTFYMLGSNPTILNVFLNSYMSYFLIGVGHNFTHQNSPWKYAMDLTFFSHRFWTVSHCLSHHTYSNLQIDIEIMDFEPHLYFLSSQPENKKISIISQYLILFLLPVNIVAITIISALKGKLLKQILILFFGQILVLYFCFHHTFIQSMAIWYLPHGLCSILLAASFPTHRSSQIWTAGDPQQTADFGIHIMKTTAEHNSHLSNLMSLALFQGFTNHVAHHLFSTIDKSKLNLITPLIKQNCEKFKVQQLFRERSYCEMFINYYPQLIRKKHNQ